MISSATGQPASGNRLLVLPSADCTNDVLPVASEHLCLFLSAIVLMTLEGIEIDSRLEEVFANHCPVLHDPFHQLLVSELTP